MSSQNLLKRRKLLKGLSKNAMEKATTMIAGTIMKRVDLMISHKSVGDYQSHLRIQTSKEWTIN